MEFTAGESGSMVSFDIDLFFLILICSFGGCPYSEEVDCNPKRWLYPH
jgi:hypothetical protein